MNKPKRFMIEYANYLFDQIGNMQLAEKEKTELLRKIDRAIFNYQCGLITIDETMKALCNCYQN